MFCAQLERAEMAMGMSEGDWEVAVARATKSVVVRLRVL